MVVGLSGPVAAISQELGAASDRKDVHENTGLPKDVPLEWEGQRTAEGRSQTIRLHVSVAKSRETATVDLPEFGALDIPTSHFQMSGDKVHLELVGDSSTAFFDGSLSGDTIRGSWKEGERAGVFELKSVSSTGRQFHTEDVSFRNRDVRLSGTLLLPEGTKPVPAIVFVQGAGPETRSASKFLAEYFAERGIAALIYDKRGAGASTGDWKHSSFEDLARDVTASVTLLRGRPEIDSHRIGLMGSSQGGWIAPMAATELSGIAFVIAKSAAAVTPEQQELARVGIQMRAEGDSADDIAQALHLYKHAIAYANSESDWDSLKAEIAADSQKKWTMFDADTPRDYWFFDQIRLFFGHDPLSVIRELKSPLLVIFGGRDDDGPPLGGQIGPLMTAMSAQGKKCQLTIFPDAGHDLRVVADKGQAWQFERFAPGYLDTLTSWVEAQTK